MLGYKAELKVPTINLRLITENIYRNENGDLLILFESQATHKEVSRVANHKGHMHTINCNNVIEQVAVKHDDTELQEYFKDAVWSFHHDGRHYEHPAMEPAGALSHPDDA